MPTDARLGIVRLSLPDGRAVPLRFSWDRIDAVGRAWIVERFEAVIAGGEGCQQALAELLVLASGDEVKAAEMFDTSASPMPFELVSAALLEAWHLARFGPNGKADGQPTNPQKSRPTWLRRLFARQSR